MCRKRLFLFFKLAVVLTLVSSCSEKTYVLTNTNSKTGVDLTKGKWLLNELDCPKENTAKLTDITSDFFEKNLNDRYFYRKNVSGLLIPRQIPLSPTKQKLKELKEGTGFDFFINISSKKNKNDLGDVGFYEDENSTGSNQSEVSLEIYDLNLQEIIYTQRAVGTVRPSNSKSVWETKKSDKLIDNISFHKNTGRLMIGSLKRILKDLERKSITNQ